MAFYMTMGYELNSDIVNQEDYLNSRLHASLRLLLAGLIKEGVLKSPIKNG